MQLQARADFRDTPAAHAAEAAAGARRLVLLAGASHRLEPAELYEVQEGSWR